jgi:probable rRNA maturation factor
MLSVAVGAETVRVPIALERVRQLAHRVLRAEGIRDALVSIAFVTPRTITQLNRRHLGHRGPTDVIAFGFAPRRMRKGTRQGGRQGAERGDGMVGDVYVAPSVARQNAERWGVGVREEVARLVIHGLLHVIGYDHPAGADRMETRMWRRQEALLRAVAGRRREKGDRRKATTAKPGRKR